MLGLCAVAIAVFPTIERITIKQSCKRVHVCLLVCLNLIICRYTQSGTLSPQIYCIYIPTYPRIWKQQLTTSCRVSRVTQLFPLLWADSYQKHTCRPHKGKSISSYNKWCTHVDSMLEKWFSNVQSCIRAILSRHMLPTHSISIMIPAEGVAPGQMHLLIQALSFKILHLNDVLHGQVNPWKCAMSRRPV